MFQISFSRWSSFGEVYMNLVVFGLISFLVLIAYVLFVEYRSHKKALVSYPRFGISIMNIFFVILFVLMLSLVQTNAYDSVQVWRLLKDGELDLTILLRMTIHYSVRKQ